MSFMVSEEVTVKEGGPRMIVTGYSSGMVECRWYDGYGVKREAFHETELVPGREVVLRKKFERVSLTPDRMWRSRRIRSGVPVSALNCLMRRYRVLSCLRYKTIDVCRVLSCHHYKIIAVLRYAIAVLCQNHKKQVGSRQGAARDKNGKPELVEKTRTPPGAGHVVNLCFIVVLLFPPCSLA